MAIPEFDPITLAIGTVGRPHGLSGELTLRLHNVAGASLETVPRVLLERDGVREEHLVDWFRRTGQGWIFRLRDVASRAQAEKLTNARLRVDRRWLPRLADGEFFVEDLLGCEVETDSGRVLGRVAELLWNGAQDVLVIPAKEEILIPVVPAFIRSVDVLGRRVIVDWIADADGAQDEPGTTPGQKDGPAGAPAPLGAVEAADE